MADKIQSTEIATSSIHLESSAIITGQQPSGSSKPEAIPQGGGESGQGVHANAVDGRESTARPRRDRVRGPCGPRTLSGKQTSSQNARKHSLFSSSLLLNGESKRHFSSMLCGMRDYFQPEGEMEDLLVEKLTVLFWRSRRVLRAECAEIKKEGALLIVRAREQGINDDQKKVVGIRWKGANSITLNRCLRLLDELRSGIKCRGFDQEQDFRILVKLYGGGDGEVPDGIFTSYVCCMEAVKLFSSGGDPKMGAGVPLEKAKEIIDKYIEEEIKTLESMMDWVTRWEAELLEYTNAASLVLTQAMLDRLTKYETHLNREFERTLHQLERLQKMRRGQPVAPPINVQITG